MTVEQLRKALRAEPFKPFTGRLTDGRQFRVGYPGCLPIGPKASRTFGVAGVGEDYRIIDLLLATSSDYTDGKARRRAR